MLKQFTATLLLCSLLLCLSACSGTASTSAAQTTAATVESTESVSASLPDGTYSVDFNTDSSMFHVNEACEGKGTLTVKDGKMTVHVTLVSKSILNLFPGTAEDAKKDGAVLLNPTKDPVTYKDGYKETVYGFDIPVEELNVEFPLALIGKKGTWYDHTVSVTNPEPIK